MFQAHLLLINYTEDNKSSKKNIGLVFEAAVAYLSRENWKQTCLHFVVRIKQCIKCIGENNCLNYLSYQASIDPIQIPTLVSIL